MTDPPLVDVFACAGDDHCRMPVAPQTPEALHAFQKAEIERWRRVSKAAEIEIQ